jgi:hypothetical protein
MKVDRFNEYNSFKLGADIGMYNNIANNLSDEGIYVNLGIGQTSYGMFRYIHAVNINDNDQYKQLIKDAAARFIDLGYLELRIGPAISNRNTSEYYSYGKAVINNSATVLGSIEEFNEVIDTTDFSGDVKVGHHLFKYPRGGFAKGVIFFLLD